MAALLPLENMCGFASLSPARKCYVAATSPICRTIAAIISCKKDEPLNGVVLDKTLTVYVGETATLTVTFIPKNASNKKLSWESSDTHIATVANGKVTGIATGQAKITATSQNSGRIAQCIVHVIQPIEPELILVEGGTFTMGCTSEQGEDCNNGEKPAHQVTVSSFYVGKYPVTQKEWMVTMLTDPCYLHPDDDVPVHNISWNQIQEYITRLNACSGKNYRLPTEAEWEYAARGGNQGKGYKYSGSDNPDDVGWYSDDSRIHPVGEKNPNELGLYDMSGNVFEWCNDRYGKYTGTPQTNPTGATIGDERVLRGGSMSGPPIWARVSSRISSPPGQYICNGGFRLVLSAEKKD